MNCKPGDLAIVRPPRTGGHCDWTGLIVEVIQTMREKMIYPDVGEVLVPDPEPDEWLCRIIGPQKELLCKEQFGMQIGFEVSSYGRMWDSRLRPIRPDETPEESIEAMKKLHLFEEKV